MNARADDLREPMAGAPRPTTPEAIAAFQRGRDKVIARRALLGDPHAPPPHLVRVQEERERRAAVARAGQPQRPQRPAHLAHLELRRGRRTYMTPGTPSKQDHVEVLLVNRLTGAVVVYGEVFPRDLAELRSGAQDVGWQDWVDMYPELRAPVQP